MPRGAARRRRLYLGGNDRLSKHRRGIDQLPGWDLGLRHRAQAGRRRRNRHAKYDGKRVYHAIVIARPDLEIKKWPEYGRGLRISFAISSARFLRAVFSFWGSPSTATRGGVWDRRGSFGRNGKNPRPCERNRKTPDAVDDQRIDGADRCGSVARREPLQRKDDEPRR